jgi:hypothetical protein
MKKITDPEWNRLFQKTIEGFIDLSVSKGIPATKAKFVVP